MRFLGVLRYEAAVRLRPVTTGTWAGPLLPRYSSTVQSQPSAKSSDTPTQTNGAVSEQVKPFSAIPGPKGLPFIGTALQWMRSGNLYKMSAMIQKRVEKYGMIYREKMFPGLPEQVVIIDPHDVETVFRADGQWPFRPEGGEAQVLARMKARMSPGLFVSQGTEWHHNRLPVQRFTMVPRKVAEYHGDFNLITEDLIKNIDAIRDPDSKELQDVTGLLFRWSFESISMFMLGERLGNLEIENPPPDCLEFIHWVDRFFQTSLELAISLPVHNLWENKAMKAAVEAQENVFRIAMKYVRERVREIDEHDEHILEGSEEAPEKVDFLTYLMHTGNLSMEEVTANVVDMLTAGVDTTSLSLSWCLYLLATNAEKQEKLRSEVTRVLGSERVVTPNHIHDMEYLRHCIKETMRMYPIAGINQRRTNVDLVLSGYKVPAETEIFMPQMVMGRLPQLFPEPEKFSPERWDRDSDDAPNVFASLPFGFGPRMCVGRRIAELELHIALAQLVRRYRVEYLEETPMDYVQKFLVKPDRKLNLVFTDV